MKTKPPINPKRSAAKRTAGSLRRVVGPCVDILRAQTICAMQGWMHEVTSVLAYQPEIPLAHKTAIAKRMCEATELMDKWLRKETGKRPNAPGERPPTDGVRTRPEA